jgi:2-dehydro-3-deoxyphosphogluconate aldolase/(4S)-4-hydroxy-2-oxoglutarate aldolase
MLLSSSENAVSPTGGITAATAPDLLALPNVACVGGSWLTPLSLVERGDWEAITTLARIASAVRAAEPAAGM